MARRPESKRALEDWSRITTRLRDAVRGLDEPELDLRGGSEGWSIRENVHHLVEANLVASNMMIAAMATDGGEFDWTWVNPDQEWMERLGYDRASIDPAIDVLSALCRHLATLIENQSAVLQRTVRLNDAPGEKRYSITVERILAQEVEHAGDHLDEIRQIREAHSR